MSERATALSRAAQHRTLRRIAIVAIGMGILVGVVFANIAIRNARRDDRPPVPDVNDATGQRIRVQVLNATTTRGLARRATMSLRDRGFDVVETGTAPTQLDSTLVLDRSGHPDWARRVADALGGARVEARPDTSRYLDVTVLLGRTWRPPSEPFYP